jgi:hypothetical protein
MVGSMMKALVECGQRRMIGDLERNLERRADLPQRHKAKRTAKTE